MPNAPFAIASISGGVLSGRLTESQGGWHQRRAWLGGWHGKK